MVGEGRSFLEGVVDKFPLLFHFTSEMGWCPENSVDKITFYDLTLLGLFLFIIKSWCGNLSRTITDTATLRYSFDAFFSLPAMTVLFSNVLRWCGRGLPHQQILFFYSTTSSVVVEVESFSTPTKQTACQAR